MDQTIAVNSTLPTRLFLAEEDFAEGTLQVTATLSNPALLPFTAITLDGSSHYYTLAAIPQDRPNRYDHYQHLCQ